MNTPAKAKPIRAAEHLRWLVKSRSKNQKWTLSLRKTMHQYSEIITGNMRYEPCIVELLEINFSLWRAVFLSDLEEGSAGILTDAKKFADELLENNTITYTQDKGAKEFTFLYYMKNARFRLLALQRSAPEYLSSTEYTDSGSLGDKDWWTEEQDAAIKAIKNIRRALANETS